MVHIAQTVSSFHRCFKCTRQSLVYHELDHCSVWNAKEDMKCVANVSSKFHLKASWKNTQLHGDIQGYQKNINVLTYFTLHKRLCMSVEPFVTCDLYSCCTLVANMLHSE